LAAGSATLNYQWQSGPSGGPYTSLSDGGNLWGSATTALTITNITLGQDAYYQLVVTNTAGSSNTIPVWVHVLPQTVVSPGTNYAAEILLTNNAVDYWRLNETSGSPLVYDCGPGAKDGVPGSSLALGQAGPQPLDFPGFEIGNSCMYSSANSVNDFVSVPPLNLNTNTVTMMAWLNPNANQSPGAGVMLARQGSSGPATGLAFSITPSDGPGSDYGLRCFWNGVSTDSGLLVPQNIWSLVALVVTPTNASIYVVNTNGLSPWSGTATNTNCTFSASFFIGNDPADGGNGARTFTGDLDEASVFNKALTTSQILSLFTNTSGIAVVPASAPNPQIAPSYAGITTLSIVNPGTAVTLTCTAGGAPSPTVQWKKRSLGGAYVNVPGATSGTLTISSASPSDTGDYVLYASNKVGTATSATPARLLVAQANPPALVGQWLTGGTTLQDQAEYYPAGLHDGFMSDASTPNWQADVPPNFSGSSVLLSGGDAILITNTSTSTTTGDGDYRIDYDNNITNRFTIAFWAKGFPGKNLPMCSKSGDTIGWQFQNNNSTVPFGPNTGNPILVIRGLSDNNPAGENGTAARYPNSVATWHHYCGTYDSSTGVRHVYMDGVDALDMSYEWGGWTPANGYHFVLGGKESPALGSYFAGNFYDVRVYNYAVTPAEVQDMISAGGVGKIGLYLDSTNSLPLGQSEAFTVIIPVGANNSGSVTVWITNTAPTVASVRGVTLDAHNAFSVTFAQGGANTKTFVLDTIGTGTIGFSLYSAGGTVAAVTGAPVTEPQLIGHWLNGTQSLLDFANVDGANQHDGMLAAGTTINTGTPNWANDTPTGSGYSLQLYGTNAMVIKGSSTADYGYTYYSTFDDGIAEGFSCAFWAKGVPGTWTPWVCKRGAGNSLPGWSIRQRSGNTPDFTIGLTAANFTDPYNCPVNDSVSGYSTTWHHYVGTWDNWSGLRKLYVDGKLSNLIAQDYGPVPLAAYDYLAIGGQDQCEMSSTSHPNITTYFTGKIYDVRMYNYALSANEVGGVYAPPAAGVLTAAADGKEIEVSHTGIVSFSLPPGATLPVTVTVNNNNPAVASVAGGNSFTITFPAGPATYTTARLTVTGLSQGTASITVSAAGMTSATATVPVNDHQLVGHWFVGATNLTEYSGFTPAGTHNGIIVGKAPASLAAMFSTDVPTNFPGQSINLVAGNASTGFGILVTNSSMLDYAYQPTFDDVINNQFTIAFWTKGAVATAWSPWLTKHGDDSIGWRFCCFRLNNVSYEDLTLRQTAPHLLPATASASDGAEDMIATSTSVYNGNWHHVAAVWDGYNGIRQVYVDGAIDPGMTLTGDYGPYDMASNHHLVIGGEENNTVSQPFGLQNSFIGAKVYDLRIYNYPLTSVQVNALMTPPSGPRLTAQLVAGQVQLSWSDAYPGYGVQTKPAVPGGSWSWTSLTVTHQTGQYSASDTVGASPKFYRLAIIE